MPAVYSVGIWTVKPGREAEFETAWRAMAEATVLEFPDARGTLLQDPSRPNRFLSFGPWPDVSTVDRWRASPAFREGVERIRACLDGFEPGTYELRAEIAASDRG